MSHQLERVCVVGLGYIGLPTASLLATKGFAVTGVDVSEDVVKTIRKGGIHIVEPDLDILVKSAVNSGNLVADTVPTEADVFIIAVPTPLNANEPDLSYIEAAVRQIVPYVRPGNLVILESTSPVGTTEDVVAKGLREAGHDTDSAVFVAHCPERVLPGRILVELIQNDRIVGGVNDASTAAAVKFYEKFVSGKVLGTTARTAELVKLTENSYRDVNIAFANEISMICEVDQVNTWEVIELANKHPRVNILNPGPGVGGHCIAVDPWFIIHRQPELAKLIRSAREVNNAKPTWVIDRVRHCAEKFKHPVIGCLGLSFKADVDDLRESPALDIVNHLVAERMGEILVCEPNLKKHPCLSLCSLEEVIAAADIVLILVDHRPFRKITAASLKEKVVIDTRGIVR
ncbi:MAG: UDP-N-acetyl-D-mannosamine dehydrogenase [Pseudomonadales bacterium]